MRYLIALITAFALLIGTHVGSGHSLSTTPVRAAGTQCAAHADQIGPWSENSMGARFRIQLGGSPNTDDHFDYYPQSGVMAVSYIIMENTPLFYANGYGTEWQFQAGSCDLIQNITWYLSIKIGEDPGQSGLGVDAWLSTGELRVFANLRCLPWTQVVNLIQAHMGAMEGLPAGMTVVDETNGACGTTSVVTTPAAPAMAAQPPAPSVDCEQAVHTSHDPIPEQWYTFPGTGTGWILLEFWTNSAGFDQTLHKVILSPSDNYEFRGGGSSYFRDASCETAARNEFNGPHDVLPEWMLSYLVSVGLARHR